MESTGDKSLEREGSPKGKSPSSPDMRHLYDLKRPHSPEGQPGETSVDKMQPPSKKPKIESVEKKKTGYSGEMGIKETSEDKKNLSSTDTIEVAADTITLIGKKSDNNGDFIKEVDIIVDDKPEKYKMVSYETEKISLAAITIKLEEPNGDGCIIDRERNMFFVLDGEKHGYVGNQSSKLVKEYIIRRLPEVIDKISIEEKGYMLEEIMRGAHQELRNNNRASTTVTGGVLMDDLTLVMIHSGDSRGRRFKKGSKSVEHLTIDNDRPRTKEEQQAMDQKAVKVDKRPTHRAVQQIQALLPSFDNIREYLNDEHIQNEIQNMRADGMLPSEDDYSLDKLADHLENTTSAVFRNQVSNVLGDRNRRRDYQPVKYIHKLEPGHIVMCSSDGADDNVSDTTMVDIIQASTGIEDAVREISETAKKESVKPNNQDGSLRFKPDDITLLMFEIKERES